MEKPKENLPSNIVVPEKVYEQMKKENLLILTGPNDMINPLRKIHDKKKKPNLGKPLS